MNTPVSFQLAKLLKEKSFNLPCIQQYTYNGDVIYCVNNWGQPKLKTNDESYSDSGGDCISAPTIAQVVMWLYEKHDVWISVLSYSDEELNQTLWENKVIDISDDYNDCSDYTFYHSPTEAYEAAIGYVLNNLI